MYKLKNIMLLVVALLATIIITGCNKDSNPNNPDDGNPYSGTSYAPSDVTGKTCNLNQTYRYKFGSNTNCTVYSDIIYNVLNGTPSCSYTKTGNNTATLKVGHKSKMTVGQIYTNFTHTFDVILTFTSATGGTFYGTNHCITSSNRYAPTDDFKNINGNFSLY